MFSRSPIKKLLALVFCLLALPQAHACLGLGMSYTLFFEAGASSNPDSDLVAEVSLVDVNRDAQVATAAVQRVIKTSDGRIRTGEKFKMRYESSSCGPDPIVGLKGVVIAKIGTDFDGRPVLYPYAKRRDDDQILAPYALFGRTPDRGEALSDKRDELARSNSNCAAHYEVGKQHGAWYGSGPWVADRLNVHKGYAMRLHEAVQSQEDRYAADLARKKQEFEDAAAKGEVNAYVVEGMRACRVVELSTALSIQKYKLKLN